MEQGGRTEAMDAEEGQGGPRDEDAGLVEEGVGRVERAIGCERCGGEGEKEDGEEAHVDGVL